MSVVWIACVITGLLFFAWVLLGHAVLGRPPRSAPHVEALQPERLAQLTREVVAAGFEVIDERHFAGKLPFGGVAIRMVDLAWDAEHREVFVAESGARPISARAHVEIVAATGPIPFELQLYQRDFFMWSRGLERTLSRAFKQRYLLASQEPAERDAVVRWMQQKEAEILDLAPSRIYVRRCRCGQGHGPSVEVIVELAAFVSGHAVLARSLALIAALGGTSVAAPYRR